MDTVQNQVWGPALWLLLHSSAERIGIASLKRLPHEESRLWSQLLQSLRFSLPCPQCKRHYQLFFSAHPPPIPSASAAPSLLRRDEIRTWLYRLHTAVNDRMGKGGAHGLSLSEVEERYSQPFCFSAQLQTVAHHMRASIQRGGCRREDVVQTLRYAEEMKRFYDFF